VLFNSPVFIFLFLPITFFVYHYLNSRQLFESGKVWLVLTSLFFYAYWNPVYLILILGSIGVNFYIGQLLLRSTPQLLSRRALLIAGILFNVCLLGYFKYTDFFIASLNTLFSSQIPILKIVLPLAISFFTFTQISYLVDTYKNECVENDLLSYTFFVTFFPHLIAGPIVHHREMMPQFNNLASKKIDWKNINTGLVVFGVGLFKKVVIADQFAIWANQGFENADNLGFWDAWGASLSYTFQLYYDFSGYADMAIGSSLLFNIRLPINFNSPYKAQNIQDFWRRWHMTLSRWLRDYVYIALGGNRVPFSTTLRNVFLVAFISGIWHGAGWTFVIWGTCHGLALLVHRLWNHFGYHMHRVLGWLTTFLFVSVTWVIFRAENMSDSNNIMKSMLGLNGGFGFSTEVLDQLAAVFNMPVSSYLVVPTVSHYSIIFGLLFIPIVTYFKNSTAELLDKTLNAKQIVYYGFLFSIAVIASITSSSSVFLYFNF
jgi:alginate O-acetyltransferase complex protein AlgI